ncbi:MAG: copper ion binding protein [Oscillospiraceae bacterium]|jgi:copper ion binding protein|nr:copper ion binding protein [Oscillospiraceae bacterium]
METITIGVEGMSCSHCEITVSEAVGKLPGITSAKASRKKKQVAVKYDSALVSPDKIRAAIAETGYDVVA